MSALRRHTRPRTKSIQPMVASSPDRAERGGLRQRWPYYAAAAVIAVLALAWIDGGEEPIRPIVQTIERPG
ncbi:MAG: hypothetical protein AAGK01_04785, partial [Pseudomonadota bacterium]